MSRRIDEGVSTKYSKPPIVEAVCEFRLPFNMKWDLTIYGSVYEKLKHLFPNKKDIPMRNIEFSDGPGELQQKIGFSTHMQISTEDNNRLVRIGPKVFLLSLKSPYPGWDEMKRLLSEVLEAVGTSVELRAFSRIGLRYINVFELPDSMVELQKYFNFRPIWPWVDLVTSEVTANCLFNYKEGRDACRIIIADQKTEKGKPSSFVLDLDYFLKKPEAVKTDEALPWVEEAHETIVDLFEGSITKDTRNLLGVSQ